MLTRYIDAAMRRARYELIEDGTYFGSIPGLQGVWANAQTLEECRGELQEGLEGWLILKLQDGDEIPPIGRVRLRTQRAKSA